MTLEDLKNFFNRKREEAKGNTSPITSEERQEVWRLAGEQAYAFSAEKIAAAEDRARKSEEYARNVEAYSKEQLAAMQTLFCKAVSERELRIAELESEVERLSKSANA